MNELAVSRWEGLPNYKNLRCRKGGKVEGNALLEDV